ncbi:MAG TPA: cupin domain-containing protein [Blastocatellia bacterium]|jgi:quercetin dioxygenase-like cupin family protein|nr:cupin domain-containing protein [Blastocatellia bacterium]
MNSRIFGARFLAIAVIVTGAASFTYRSRNISSQKPPDRVALLRTETLPKGDYRNAAIATVEYSPGGETKKHRHDVAIFAYVLEGAVESQLDGQEIKTYKKGDTWYEPPGTIHAVSRNASRTEPAKLLVFAVGEEGKATTTFVQD